MSGRRDRSPPPPSVLCDHPRRSRRHPGHYITIPDVVEACGDGTPPHQLLYPRMASRQRHPRALTRAVAGQETFAPPPSKPLLDAHRMRHDALPEARLGSMVVYSATLYTIPLHVGKIVRHACKLPPPWPIKERQSPSRARGGGGGATDSAHLHAFRLHRDSGTRLNQYLWDLEASPPLPPRL
jgi:hypothetical protein